MDPRRQAVRREGAMIMAQLAAAFGSSHSVMLAAELQDWLRGFRQSDLRMKYYDREHCRLRAFARLVIVHDHVRTGPAQRQGNRPSDALTGARHQRHLALQRFFAHHRPP